VSVEDEDEDSTRRTPGRGDVDCAATATEKLPGALD
jgi:hypothetical protein